MEVRPGYKLTEVGVIPEEWEISNVLENSSCVTKGTTPTSIGRNFSKSGINFLKAESISEVGKLIPEKVAFIDNLTYGLLKRSQLMDGDLLISIAGVLGRVGLVDQECLPANTNQALAIIRLKETSRVDTMYLFKALGSPIVQKQIKDVNVQLAQANISLKDVVNLHFPLPPTIKEQKAIAKALGDVNAVIESLDRLIAKKRDIKQAAMQELLTGKKRLPGFYGEWRIKYLGDIFTFHGGHSASRDQLSIEGFCYLHYGDIHKFSKTFIDVKAEYHDIPKLNIDLKLIAATSLLEDGDVVFVDASEDDEGTSRHIVVINKEKKPYISGLHTIVAKSKTIELANEFKRYCFQTPEIKKQFLFYSAGTKVTGISKTNIPKLTLAIPSVTEQTAIAAVLSEMDSEIAALEQRRDKTKLLKQAMMQELLTGRIRLI